MYYGLSSTQVIGPDLHPLVHKSRKNISSPILSKNEVP
jgi:hypothetical protein